MPWVGRASGLDDPVDGWVASVTWRSWAWWAGLWRVGVDRICGGAGDHELEFAAGRSGELVATLDGDLRVS